MNIPQSEQILQNITTFLYEKSLGIVLSLVIIIGLGQLVNRLANSFIREDRRRFKIKKSARYLTIVLSLFWILLLYQLHFSEMQSFHFYIFGILLAGLAFTMRGLFADFLGWVIVASHKAFHTGDRIQVGDIRGDVIDTGLLRTTLAEVGEWEQYGEQSTGRMITLPNGDFLQKSVINYSRGFNLQWSELTLTITFESDWKKAEAIMHEIAMAQYREDQALFAEKMQEVRREHMLQYRYISPKVYTRIGDSGVVLTLRQMVEVRKRRLVIDEMNRGILEAFKSETDIEFAYNTMRLYKKD